MSTVDLSNYKDLYITTSKLQLQKIEEGIVSLSTDTFSKQGCNTVYINAHTLVSKSMLMGYTQIGSLSRNIETIFYAVKQEKFQLTPQFLETLSLSVKALGEALHSIEVDNKEIDLSAYTQALQEISHMEFKNI
jgi:chemotaxis protein histidine kinase CheA